MTRLKSLVELLNQLEVLYNDLNNLIAQYEVNLEWKEGFETAWKTKDYPCGILCSQRLIYSCQFGSDYHLVTTYNSIGECIKENTALSQPVQIDIDNTILIIYC